MSSDAFQMSSPDLVLLERLFRKAPKKMQAAGSGVLNSQAFGLRMSILKTLEREMTIRSVGFVKGRVRVAKAKSGPINSIEAEAGSIFGDRFDGWRAQQLGTKSERKVVHTKFSRGGSWAGKVFSRHRNTKQNPMHKISDFNITNAKNKKHRLIIYLQMLNKAPRKRFLFPGRLGKMKPGAYKRVAGNMRGVWTPRSMVSETRRIKWMDISMKSFRRELNLQQLWDKNIKFMFRLK